MPPATRMVWPQISIVLRLRNSEAGLGQKAFLGRSCSRIGRCQSSEQLIQEHFRQREQPLQSSEEGKGLVHSRAGKEARWLEAVGRGGNLCISRDLGN